MGDMEGGEGESAPGREGAVEGLGDWEERPGETGPHRRRLCA